MALKIYRVGQYTFQFEEGKQPKGAEEVKEKAKQPRNKAAKAEGK